MKTVEMMTTTENDANICSRRPTHHCDVIKTRYKETIKQPPHVNLLNEEDVYNCSRFTLSLHSFLLEVTRYCTCIIVSYN
jgi:hypothetical protein